MTLTRRGSGLLAAAAGLLVLARLFGSAELAGLAAAAGLAVVAAAVITGRVPMTYRGERWLAPARVSAGDPASARLRFTNTGPRPTPAGAEAIDPFGNPSSASTDRPGVAATPSAPPRHRRPAASQASGRCLVPSLTLGAMAEANHELPTARRGTIAVGPLTLRVSDPLGLVERRAELAGPARLVVHPRIHPVLALPGSSTREARRGATRPARAARGDDFFALREYEVGDDLRRVHWRSTARLGELMLRQDEARFGEVATVLLDTRAQAHTTDSFERALEVAASVAAALVEDGRRLRFVTTGGFEMEFDAARAGEPPGHRRQRWTAVLEHLALLSPDRGGTDAFALTVQSIRHHPSGPLAAVVAAADPTELAALGALRARLGLVLVAHCDPMALEDRARGVAGGVARRGNGDQGEASAPAVPGAVVVPVVDMAAFPEVWNHAVLSYGHREAVRR